MSSLPDRSQDIQIKELEGPDRPSHAEPFDIPVLVDDVKHLEGFEMTRWTFFTIDATTAVEDWVALLRERGIPFLLLGVSPVIHRPSGPSTRFTSPDQIDQLFKAIEDIKGLVVETAHIWLPNFLFEGDGSAWDLSPSGEDSGGMRGAVWRLSLRLFGVALLYQREVISGAAFSSQCHEHMQSSAAPVKHSPEETTVFRVWSADQIEAARINYLQQREDPDRDVLEYVDESGHIKAG
jgi:hypothetical protein